MPQSRTTGPVAAGLCRSGCCLLAMFIFGLAGSAKAADLLFSPLSSKFPYHMVGSGGATVLETLSGKKVEAASADVLALVLSPTLVDLHVEYLKVKSEGTACHNDGKTEAILLNLLGHFGRADPNELPAVLLLVPSGFEFECLGGLAKVKMRGAVIGAIIDPGRGEETEELGLTFNQTKGKQEYTTFLLGSETLTNEIEETSFSGGAFEQTGQQGEPILFKALAGEGKFQLNPPQLVPIENPLATINVPLGGEGKVTERYLNSGGDYTFTSDPVFVGAEGFGEFPSGELPECRNGETVKKGQQCSLKVLFEAGEQPAGEYKGTLLLQRAEPVKLTAVVK
jgi:hypothetical protein